LLAPQDQPCPEAQIPVKAADSASLRRLHPLPSRSRTGLELIRPLEDFFIETAWMLTGLAFAAHFNAVEIEFPMACYISKYITEASVAIQNVTP